MNFAKLTGLALPLAFGFATAATAFTACQVTDTGGIDDNSFNQTAWQGVLDAQEELGIEGRFLESQAETDYEANLNSLLGGQCDIILTIGFLLGDATQAAAEANPDQLFSIVDFAYDPVIENVLGQVYATDEAAFLAGYLAAGMTETEIVGTFGGINIPPVTIFMDGFSWGVDTTTACTAPTSRFLAGTLKRAKACSPTTSNRSMTEAPSRKTSMTRARTSSCPWRARRPRLGRAGR
jgi:basic membrane protein A